ncbi:hypothetical protein RIF29_19738 [Crotalaria pallida]|uniref:Thioredoxin domain-containing protein n=1 Tax=Crotalaria pallida TaxID=3830 RepID=A0AAN9F012_CROPI
MAEVLIKTNLVSSWHGHKQHHHGNFGSGASCTLKRFPSLKLKSHVLGSSSFPTEFNGKNLVFRVNRGIPKTGKSLFRAQMGPIGKAQKWWEKGLQPNMREVSSAQDLADSLFNSGDKLVVLDFFSPGCGGCRALHPKICQLAEMNPDVQFLQINYEEHKSMCYSLNVHVLPFFRFYRGAHGRLCSFSCTIATIKKFKDALAKHTPDRSSLGPTKGLEEKELIALSENKDLSFTYTPKPDQPLCSPENEEFAEAQPRPLSPESLPLPPITPDSFEVSKEKTLIIPGR